MSKYHLNPITGPMRCNATVRECPYGGETEHYEYKKDAIKAFEEKLAAMHPIVKYSKKNNNVQEKLIEKQVKDFESLDYETLESFVNERKSHFNAFEKVLNDRINITRQHFMKLENINPFNPSNVNVCDKSTFKELKKEFNVYRNKTAELVEALNNSRFNESKIINLPDDVSVGKLQRVTALDANSHDWIKARYDTVGGSDVGIIAVMDFTKKDDLTWFDRKGYETVEKSKTIYPTEKETMERQHLFNKVKSGAIYRGTVWEERIANSFAEDYPELTIYKTKSQYINPDAPWQKINVDGLISNRTDKKPNGILEIKTSSVPEDWKNGVPLNYRAQILYYLHVSDLEYAKVRVLINDYETRDYTLYKNDEVSLGSKVTMNTYVKNRVQPWFEEMKTKRK